MSPGPVNGEVCILAGGLSTRMGRDKRTLRWQGKTLVAHIREAARRTGWPVRVIRRDLVRRLGPLGGVFTALRTTRRDAVLFLACDMPFVKGEYLAQFVVFTEPVFTHGKEGAGFPFLLPRSALAFVEKQIATGRYSLQALARRCRARKAPAPGSAQELFNINTPKDWKTAVQFQSKPCHSARKR